MLMRNVFVNVFKSDAVIWWATIFCKTSHSTCTGTVTFHVIEPQTHKKIELVFESNFRDDENQYRKTMLATGSQ